MDNTNTTLLFGTVGSPLSTPKPGGMDRAVMRLSELGLGALELGWVRSVRVSEATCELIRQAAASSCVAISVHAPYFINLNADEIEWPKSRQRLMDAAHYGFLAGATDIVFHPGSYFGKPPAHVLEVIIPRLQEVVAELRAAGNPVRLRPETMGKPAMIGSLEDLLTLSQAVPGVEPCIDFAHLYARTGDGSLNNRSGWLEVLDQYAAALGADSLQRLHCHISGIEYSLRGERNHTDLRDSGFAWEQVLEALEERKCAGRILCESPAMENDALVLSNWWNGQNRSGPVKTFES